MSVHKQSYENLGCPICNIKCASDQSLACHLRGRPHQLMLDKQREAARGIFVRGFPRQQIITQELVFEIFQAFGIITNVFVSEKFAIITYNDEASATQALGNPPIFMGKPLVVKPREVKVKKTSTPAAENRMEASPAAASTLPLPQAAVEIVKSAKSLTEQVELVSLHGSMSESTIANILSLTQQIQSLISPIYPEAIVLPFGSLITNHGTVTSDCDLCVLTNPEYKELLQPAVYYPANVQEVLAKVCPVQCSPVSSTQSTPERPIRMKDGPSCDNTEEVEGKGQRSVLKVIAGAVRKVMDAERVLVIRSARCPIVRFYHGPSQLHVDVSVNNSLGPHNSRLLSAYSSCDPRVIPLVRVIRMWVRGVTSRRVNSYATSLMVIHYLQHTSPPVLPCLQSLGQWPRNMEWFKQDHPACQVTCEPWSCDFTPTESLQPSSNSDALGSLLVGFFRYFSAQFPWDYQIITIHSLSPVTLQQANEGLPKPLANKSPLIVQDPFDRSHNITKGVAMNLFVSFQNALAKAVEILETSRSLVDIFVGESPPKKLRTEARVLQFDVPQLVRLFEVFQSPLASALHLLDMTSHVVAVKVHTIVAHFITSLMKERFNFECKPLIDEKAKITEKLAEYTDPLAKITDSSSEITDHSMEISDIQTEITDPIEKNPTPVGIQTGLQNLEPETDQSPDKDELRKRRLSESPEPISKKSKGSLTEKSPIELLEFISSQLPASTTYHCSAYENTWVGTRKKRREEMRGMMESLPLPDKAILEAKMKVHALANTVNCITCVRITPIEAHHKAHLDTWFSVFKPLVPHD